MTSKASRYAEANLRCSLCGKFRKAKDVVDLAVADEAELIECRWCMSECDLDRYFPE
jgi:hypothetical protein